MLTALLIALLTGQRQLPAAHPSTWDGVPGSEVIRTDEATGEITYPMGQQPPDALALGCVFGRSNVRCPKPPEPINFGALAGAEAGSAGDGADAADDAAASAFAWFAESYVKDPATLPMAEQLTTASSDDVIFPSDVLSGSGIEPGNGENQKDAEAEPEPEPQARAGCHREEYRYEDGSGGGVRVVCSSGDQRLLDSVTDALDPSAD